MSIVKRFKDFFNKTKPRELYRSKVPDHFKNKLYKSVSNGELDKFKSKHTSEDLTKLEKNYLNKISSDEAWSEVFNKFSFVFRDGESDAVVNKYQDEWFVAIYNDGEWSTRYLVDSFEGVKQLLLDKFGVYSPN